MLRRKDMYNSDTPYKRKKANIMSPPLMVLYMSKQGNLFYSWNKSNPALHVFPF